MSRRASPAIASESPVVPKEASVSKKRYQATAPEPLGNFGLPYRAIEVDLREPRQLRYALGWELNSAPALPHSDLRWVTSGGKVVLGQRKTVGDLASSIRSNRIWYDIRNLVQNADIAFILREGWQKVLPDRSLEIGGFRQPRDMNFERLDDVLLEAQLEYNILLVLSPSLRWTPQRLACLYRFLNEGERSGVSRVMKKGIPALLADDRYNRAVASLMCIRSIGQATAITLLNYFHTLERIATASEAELLAIKGVGAKTAQAVMEHYDRKHEIWEELQ